MISAEGTYGMGTAKLRQQTDWEIWAQCAGPFFLSGLFGEPSDFIHVSQAHLPVIAPYICSYRKEASFSRQ